ncbi:MAG: DMT family transporter [Betaproteobacteria bacterium]|nr:DMT family transporter [Betaproteobacteria bacterium]
MAGAVLSFCAMAIAARELLRHIGVFEILFFRTGVALAIVLAIVLPGGAAVLRTRLMGVHLWRNLFHLGGQASWVYAIGALPLATVFAIEFTSPIFTALLAALMLAERMNRGRLVMLALGFAGVLVILRPGLAVVQPASLVMILGSFCFAVQMIGTKRLAGSDAPLTVLFWMSVIQTPFCLAAALPGWTPPALADLPWIAVIGGGSFTAHYCLTRAMKFADATVVVPVDFFRLPLIAVVGALFYAEPFDPAVILGAALIFTGTYYSVSRERGAARPG